LIKNRRAVVLLMASVAVMSAGLTPWGKGLVVVFWSVAILLQLSAVATLLVQARRSRRDVRR
jgi:hypothetical protein